MLISRQISSNLKSYSCCEFARNCVILPCFYPIFNNSDNKDQVKALFEQVTPGIESSISILELNMARFDAPYHFHPELELTWIRKGYGKRYIGGKVSDFESDDLVLVGSNVPHCWINEIGTSEKNVLATVIQFKKNFAGEMFWELPELMEISKLLEMSKSGLMIKGMTRQKVITKMTKLTKVDGFFKLALFIEILHDISSSAEIEIIDLQSTELVFSTSDTMRFQKVFAYLIDNYQEEVTLKNVAGIANLTPTAFCRYFKNVTRKTLVQIVTEFRINQACQLLRNSEKTVNEICFECGFGNISYFNKTFKAITEYAPLQYRNLFSG
jgi:AraC-like DNA-binding protein